MNTIPISEIFLSTQGEGALIGQVTIFVRVGGCDFRCGNCDSLYAVLPTFRKQWTPMMPTHIWDEIERLSAHRPLIITLSGGNPALYPALGELITLGKAQGYRFAVETQGSRVQPWFTDVDVLTLSPKGPGMANPLPQRWDQLDACVAFAGQGPQVVLKIVVFDEADYHYARQAAERYPSIQMYLQPGNHTPPHLDQKLDLAGILSRLDWLAKRVQQDRWYQTIVLPQMHLLLWGNTRGK
jgi:7-carboxy-7-deazaguanine synthase